MAATFKIDGFWKSDNKQFENFSTILTEEQIIVNMREAEDNAYAFVITKYKKV